jgi:hypothetical protein
MGHGNNLILQFGIIFDLSVCDDQSLSPFSMEDSWSSVDPKGSKFAQWFHFEGMKRTPIYSSDFLLSHYLCMLCYVCVHGLSGRNVLSPTKTILNNNPIMGMSCAQSLLLHKSVSRVNKISSSPAFSLTNRVSGLDTNKDDQLARVYNIMSDQVKNCHSY